METDELWEEYRTAMENAKFSVIAAQLLLEETEKEMPLSDLRSYRKRHNKHIRASAAHLRQARRIHRKIEKIEKRWNGRRTEGA